MGADNIVPRPRACSSEGWEEVGDPWYHCPGELDAELR